MQVQIRPVMSAACCSLPGSFFWSFEESGNILRNQTILFFKHMYSKQVFIISTPFGLISVFLLAALWKSELKSGPVHSP